MPRRDRSWSKWSLKLDRNWHFPLHWRSLFICNFINKSNSAVIVYYLPTPGKLWTKRFQKTNWKEWTTSVIPWRGKDLAMSHVKVELLAVMMNIVQKKSERSNNQNNTFTVEKLYIFNDLLRGIVNWIAVEFMIFSNNWETYNHCEWRNFQNSAPPMNVTKKHLTCRPGYWSNLVFQNVCSTTYHLLIHMKHLTCQIFQ